MDIPLPHFEQFINEKILSRGLSYFKNGLVTSFEELSPGEFEAEVEGTEDYDVRLTVRNNKLTGYSCTCPYDYGTVCKHIVAVLYYLKNEDAAVKRPDNKKGTPGKPAAKRKTVSEQVDEMLSSLSHDDLKSFIKEQCITYPEFRRSFLSGFMYKSSAESPEKYREQVKGILNSAKDKDRFINWSRAGMVGKAVNEILGIAMKHVESGNWLSACHICFPVAEEMVKALQFADDSDGDIGSNIETAFEILYSVSTSQIPEEIRVYLLDQVLKHYRKNNFSGWDWQTDLLDIAVELVKTEKEAGVVLSLLHAHVHSEYEAEQMTKLEYDLISKMKGDAEAEKFAAQNLDNPDLRRKALEKALKDKNFEKAKSLAHDGIKNDADTKPGLAKEWYDWLLRAAIAEKDKPHVIEYARHLFIDGFRKEQDYYGILKQNTDPAEWNSYVEGLIDEIRRKSRWLNIDVLGKIYITEQWWDRLLKLVSETKHLSYIQHYEQYLAGNYSAELAELYEKGITDFLKKNIGRKHYEEACRYMGRMIILGARNRVNNLIVALRKEYPQRTALMDELNKI
ncbi:MAG TPA: SWIM zinc finger family protein [Bacteroidales bacterium]|nr:SWIM zinc finger family protein [Bacteroidales bacterium]